MSERFIILRSLNQILLSSKYKTFAIIVAVVLLLPTQFPFVKADGSTVAGSSDPRIDSSGEQRVSFYDGLTNGLSTTMDQTYSTNTVRIAEIHGVQVPQLLVVNWPVILILAFGV
jgi:hypothetical protein